MAELPAVNRTALGSSPNWGAIIIFCFGYFAVCGTSKYVMTRIQEIDERIQELRSEKIAIQDGCSHPPVAVRYLYGADTGNWDRGSDTYWTEYHCTLCEKRWSVVGSVSIGGAREVKKREDL